MAHRIIPVRYYLINAVVLTALMVLTVVAAKVPAFHFSNNPNGINLLIALVIAIAKAACIVAIFMGSYWSSGLVRLLSAAGFLWLCIFFLFMATDYLNPLEEFGTPYLDVQSPGSNPLAGGQDHPNIGRELTPAHGGHYTPPPHLFGHEAEPATGAPAAEHH